MLLLEEVKSKKITGLPLIVRAESVFEAEILYKRGADYVIIPEIVAGDLLTDKLKDHMGEKDYWKARAKIELEKLNRKTISS